MSDQHAENERTMSSTLRRWHAYGRADERAAIVQWLRRCGLHGPAARVEEGGHLTPATYDAARTHIDGSGSAS